MGKFLVRVYCPYCEEIIEEEAEAEDAGKAVDLIVGEEWTCSFCGRSFKVFKEYVVHVAAVVIMPPVEAALRYAEVSFRTREEGETYARAIEERAVEGAFDYMFGFGGRTIRAKVYKSFNPYVSVPRPEDSSYWIVKRMTKEPYIRVWQVRISNFAICALKDGKRSNVTKRMPEGYVYRGEDLSGEILQLCDYHFPVGRAEMPIIEGKIFPKLPDALCFEYCPQCWVSDIWDSKTGRFVKKAKCVLWSGILVTKKFRDMSALCMQDDWWRYYWV